MCLFNSHADTTCVQKHPRGGMSGNCFAAIPSAWRKVLKDSGSSRSHCGRDLPSMCDSGVPAVERYTDKDGRWEACIETKTFCWLRRMQVVLNIVIADPPTAAASADAAACCVDLPAAAEETFEAMWAFAGRSMVREKEGDVLYVFEKQHDLFPDHDEEDMLDQRQQHHRMLFLICEDRVVLIDLCYFASQQGHGQQQKNQALVKMEVHVNEGGDLRVIENLLMEGPMATWYHPCCNDRMLHWTCEEAMAYMQDCVKWQCVQTPAQLDADWDENTLAFAMSQHARLGEESTVPRHLDCSTLQRIFAMVQREPLPPVMSTFELLDWLACTGSRGPERPYTFSVLRAGTMHFSSSSSA